MNKSATNKLYYGEVDDLRDAIVLHAQALRDEAKDTAREEREDPEVYPSLSEPLLRDARRAGELLAEYDKLLAEFEKNLIQRWRKSGDSVAVRIAEAASSGDWSELAV